MRSALRIGTSKLQGDWSIVALFLLIARDSLRVAGLILRRNPEQEFHSYIPLLPYHPGDYQVLLRK